MPVTLPNIIFSECSGTNFWVFAAPHEPRIPPEAAKKPQLHSGATEMLENNGKTKE